ncbi:hypothetical protein IFM89_029851 [Coptis chinensis]|uniref:NAC domain-containing protein n=1 Tax=Coptis chinensis TaxID=261450 RepID=A0A835HQE6_9MAGN|nr:hypothetical protein IFM89_029851 [Coptis chinensis]
MVVTTRKSSGVSLSVSEKEDKTKFKKQAIAKKGTKKKLSKDEARKEYLQHQIDMQTRLILEERREAEIWKKAEMESLREMFSNGLAFNPTDTQLVNYYLNKKNAYFTVTFFPIQEVNDLYANHPITLTEMSGLNAETGWYFFTKSRPNRIQPGTNVQGEWIFAKEEDVFYQDVKVGEKHVYEYWECDQKKEYKMIEYQLVPAPKPGRFPICFLCKLCIDANSVEVQS